MFETIKIQYDENELPDGVWMDGIRGKKVKDKDTPTGGHSGINKFVFVFANHVVKFPRYGGLGEVRREYAEADKKHFAEVVYASLDKRWYVQKRIECVPNARVTDENFKVIRAILQKYNINDVSTTNARYYGAGESITIGHNWTVDINGNEVIYDY